MPRMKTIQQRVSVGELSPEVIGRTDIDQYYGGLETMRNVFPMVEGGYRRRPGLPLVHRVQGLLAALANPTATAPNGGTASNGYDSSTTTLVTTTTPIGTTNPYVVLQYDYGSAMNLGEVNIINIYSNAANAVSEVQQLAITGSTGEKFTLTFSGQTTAEVQLTATAANDAATIQTALNNLSNLSGVTVAFVSARTYNVTFAGADTGIDQPLMTFTATVGTPTATITETVKGCPASSANVSEFYIQYSTDGTNWTNAEGVFSVGSASMNVSRTVGALARYLRIARVGATDMGARVVNVGYFNTHEEGGESETRLIPFVFNTDQTYMIVASDETFTIIRNREVVASVYYDDYSSDKLAELDWEQEGDTLILFHPDVQPHALQRQGNDAIWTIAPITLSNIPRYGFGDGSGQDEIQTVRLSNVEPLGTFSLTVDGQTTDPIVVDNGATPRITTASNMQTALNALSNLSGVTVVDAGSWAFTVTFAGADGKKPWPLIIVNSSGGANTGSSVHKQNGGDEIWSATRGWPRHGALFQGRLWLDGGPSRPSVMFGSVVENFYSFYQNEGLDDEAIGPLTFEGYNHIQSIYPANFLTVLTSAGEYIIPQTLGEAITPANAQVKRLSRVGSASNLRPQELDGGIYYVQRGKQAVRQFIYDDTGSTAFSNNIISLLSNHLVENPVDIAISPTNENEQNSYLAIVQSDGNLTIAGLSGFQKVACFACQTTSGTFKNVANDDGDIYVVVRRLVNGTYHRFLEVFDFDYYTDCATKVTTGLPTAAVSGLTHLEGVSCRVIADGIVLGNETPSSGAVTIDDTADTYIEIGRNFNPTVKDLPVELPDIGSTLGMPINVSEVDIRLLNTRHIQINEKSLPIDPYAENAFTGVKYIKGFRGWGDNGQITITQDDPLPMTVLSVAKRVNV